MKVTHRDKPSGGSDGRSQCRESKETEHPVERRLPQPRCEVISAGTREVARGMERKKHFMHQFAYSVSK